MPNESISIIENRKVFKRNKVLNLIRTNEHCSRYDIKKMTSYSMATVLTLIDELIKSGYIIEEESSRRHVGRKPMWLSLNPKYGYFVGIEFHAFQINCAALDFMGELIFQTHQAFDHNDHAETILKKVSSMIAQAVAQQPDGKLPLGIGLAIPGYYDTERGIGIEYRPIESWKNIPVKAYFESRFHVPCIIENNVTAVAVGYQNYHLGNQRADDFLFVSIRSGIRLVAMSDHTLILCNKGYGGQLGHIKLYEGNNRLCLCGKRGCLNTEVADTGLKQKILEDVAGGNMTYLLDAVEGHAENISIPLFVDSVMEGRERSVKLVEETADYLGKALGMMTDIFAPTRIIIYGELARCGNVLLEPTLCSLRRSAMRDNTEHLELTLCAPEERLGAYGAARLVMCKQYEYIKETV